MDIVFTLLSWFTIVILFTVLIFLYLLSGCLSLSISKIYFPAHLSFCQLFLVLVLWPLFMLFVAYIELAKRIRNVSIVNFETWMKRWWGENPILSMK